MATREFMEREPFYYTTSIKSVTNRVAFREPVEGARIEFASHIFPQCMTWHYVAMSCFEFWNKCIPEFLEPLFPKLHAVLILVFAQLERM